MRNLVTIGKKAPVFQLQYDPARIPELVAKYMAKEGEKDRRAEEFGTRIANGDLSSSNLEVIYRWKSPRSIRHFRNNSESEIKHALKEALSAPDIKKAVCALTSLKGVRVKMASAILTAIDPGRYTVLDFRALEALGARDSEDLDLYVPYVKACRSMADRYGVTLRDFDRANWQWSKDQANHCTAEQRHAQRT
jgi:hypothetical protein